MVYYLICVIHVCIIYIKYIIAARCSLRGSCVEQAVRRLVHSRSQGTGLLLNDRTPSINQLPSKGCRGSTHPHCYFGRTVGVASSYFRGMEAVHLLDC